MDTYRAIVIGGTGAVGSSLVRELIASPLCREVVLVARRRVNEETFAANGKLRAHVVDMAQLGNETIALARNCQAAFSTMGIGQPRKIPKQDFWKVDVEYASSFARACKIAGVEHFSLLSSIGADPNSRINYLHVKGVAEERILQLGFARVSFFRPSLLVTKQIRYGLQDRLAQTFFPLFSRFLAPQYHEITVEEVGRAMRLNAEAPRNGVAVLSYPDLRLLLDARPMPQAIARAGMSG